MTNGRQNHCNYPSQQLAGRIASHTLNSDPAQRGVALELDQLLERLIAARFPRGSVLGAANLLLRWLGLSHRDTVKGLYIHGGVGRGKTMLMDMFHESVKVLQLDGDGVPAIWRLHFHDFMVLAQDLIHEARHNGADDPIESAAAELAARGMVVCFDEMEVRDIADALVQESSPLTPTEPQAGKTCLRSQNSHNTEPLLRHTVSRAASSAYSFDPFR